jgi:hypothetical protein
VPTEVPRHSTFSDNQADRSLDIERLTGEARPKTTLQGNMVSIPTRARWSVAVVSPRGLTSQVGQGANAQQVTVKRNDMEIGLYNQNSGDLVAGRPMSIGAFMMGKGDVLTVWMRETGSTPTPKLSASEITIICEASP